MSEAWKPVVGFDGLYEVSDLGRVRGLDRIDGQGRRWRGRILKLQRTRGGYLSVILHAGSCADLTHVRISRMVLEAFTRQPRPNEEAAHLNGKRADNQLDNLQWKTKIENETDKLAHGTRHKGDSHPSSILTAKQVLQARDRCAHGENVAVIARSLKKKYSTVYRAVRGLNWAHV